MTRDKKYYDFWVNRKSAGFALPLIYFWHRRMLKKAEAFIEDIQTLKILEVGVGFGYFARIAKQKGFKYSGIEMNENLVAILKKENFTVTCAVVPPFPKNTEIDIIWLSHVLEHCATYLEARNFIEKAYSALQPGGYIIIISPDILSWKMEFWNDDWSHGFPTSLINCTKILNDVGFSVIFKSHHNATVFQPAIQFSLNLISQIIPYRFLDFLIKPFTKRTLFYSLMTLFGWRQIYLIGKK